MTVLSVDQAIVEIDGKRLLGPISTEFEPSGITAILGPNGAGKSLFMALCHGTVTPISGQIQWSGASAKSTRSDRGYMLQTPIVLRRTVWANIDFALLSNGIPRPERKPLIEAALERARLTEKARAIAASLSGGELRRMNLARAMVSSPKVLLLDEPFAGLDPAASVAMEQIIEDVAKTTPVLMSHHDLAQTRRMSNRVLFFLDGELHENTLAKNFFSKSNSLKVRQFLQGQLL